MSLSEVLNAIRSLPSLPNEEAVKFKIIAPILQSLGWNPYGQQVLYEHSVGKKRAGGRVDIALKGSRGLVAIIEAKAPGADLSEHVSQVLGYAFHEGVDICALTTGIEWWLYLPLERGQPEERRFVVLSISDDPVERLADDLETFLGNQSLERGDSISKAKQVLKAEHERAILSQKIPDIWGKMVKEGDEELLDIVIKRVYQEIDLRPTRQQIANVLNDQPVTARPVKNMPPQTDLKPAHPKNVRSKQAPTGTVKGRSNTPQHTRPPKAMVLFGTSYTIEKHAKSLVTLTEVLYERDQVAFLKLLELHGRKHPYVSHNKNELHSAKEIGTSGYYIDVHLSMKNIWKRARLFMNHLGYAETDLELIYD